MFGNLIRNSILGAAIAIAPSLLGAPLKAKKDNVKVLSSPKKGSDTVATLKKGETVDSTGRKGMYWKVKTPDGKKGFVSVMKVKRQSGGESKLNSVLREAAKDDRANGNSSSIRSRSAVMGVRGLDASEQVAYAGNMKPDFRLVYRMEDRSVSQKRVDKLENSIEREIEKTME